MPYKKRFKSANTDGQFSPISGAGGSLTPQTSNFGFRNYESSLPEVYTGHPNRIERYSQYEAMDQDSEINACLDIIAEFCTQESEANGTPFEIDFAEKPTENEVKILKNELRNWIKINEFDQRIFKLFRNTVKYGDQVFIRDPETFKLFWVEPEKVSRIIVNESEGKKPEQYIVLDINPNFENLTVAAKTTNDFQKTPQTGSQGAPYNFNAPQGGGNAAQGRFAQAMNESAIDAEHIMHLSLTEGLDYYWPFGQSILENIFKVYKQKELLEDAILIYRIQRAPERRVFKIDVGNMPSHMAMQFVERIKNEIHQRRIPTANGGGQSIMDATYNPLSINEDYFFPQTSEGRGSSVDTLPGGENLGQIDDLKYFNNKLARGLRVPSSYLPTGPDDSSTPLSDGRVGTALIQEYRFNQYCERLQRNIVQKLDDEFKMFLRWRGINIDAGLFDIKFNPPQNFASYRQAELDQARAGTFGQMEGLPYISKQFALERFLGLSEEEIARNEELWHEEKGSNYDIDPEGSDLRSVGVSPGGIDADLENLAGEEDFGELDMDVEAGETPDMPNVGGMGGAGAPPTGEI
jgi:hypothetical protein